MMNRGKPKAQAADTSMIASVDIDSEVAVYVQIENHIQFAIASGKLRPNDQLPSVRELSERLGVNPNTVAKAYRDLEVMGLLYTRRGMGVFIVPGAEAKCRDKTRARLVDRLHTVAAEAKAAGMDAKEIAEIVKKSYSSTGGPYGATPPEVMAMARKK